MMKDDLIFRSALLRSVPADPKATGKTAWEWGVLYMKDVIEKAPTIDPETLRPKGRWELNGNDDDCGCSYFCSNCHSSYPEEWFYDHGQYVPFENCPHCIAKMEG